MLAKEDVGRLVLVKFWDHADGRKDLAYVEVAGRIREIGARRLLLQTWCCPRVEDKDVDGESNDFCAIVRSAIVDIVPLVEAD